MQGCSRVQLPIYKFMLPISAMNSNWRLQKNNADRNDNILFLTAGKSPDEAHLLAFRVYYIF